MFCSLEAENTLDIHEYRIQRRVRDALPAICKASKRFMNKFVVLFLCMKEPVDSTSLKIKCKILAHEMDVH